MPESTDFPQVNTRPPACKRFWRWLWLPAAVALLLLWWFICRTPQYRLIGTFVTDDVLLIPANTGFLVRDSAATFMLRDWVDGHPRWTVTVRQAQFPVGTPRMNPGFGSAYSLSPDGHVFAAATAVLDTLHMETWHDGAFAGHLTLKLDQPTPLFLFVKALNSGRVFCWHSYAARGTSSKRVTPVIAVEGDRVIARGAFPPEARMAPDGSAIAASTTTGFTYAEVRVYGGAVTLRHPYTSQDRLTTLDGWDGFVLESSLFADGIVLAENGAIYGPSGRLHPPAGRWRHQGMDPGGRYTLQFASDRIRLFSPVTWDAWTFSVPDHSNGGDATADGRHVLAWLETRPSKGFQAKLQQFLQDYPAAERLFGGLSTDYLALYQRPGRRVAILRPRLRAWWPEAPTIENRWWFPSPDGRSVAMTASGPRDGRCFLLRY